jgi:hypothetical protein
MPRPVPLTPDPHIRYAQAAGTRKRKSGGRRDAGVCPRGHTTKKVKADGDRVCDVCDKDIKDDAMHFRCIMHCDWDCCCDCGGAQAVVASKKKKHASRGKKKNKKTTVRGDDDNCGKTIEMPASFWKIKDGSYFKGEIEHTATWSFKDTVMTGYDVKWHTGESELIPLADIQPYL